MKWISRGIWIKLCIGLMISISVVYVDFDIRFVMAFMLGVDGVLAGLYYVFVWKRYDELITHLGNEGDIQVITEQLDRMKMYSGVFRHLIEAIRLYSDRLVRLNSAQIFDKQTELSALQSQINPHFLYNTLDSIRGEALIQKDYLAAKMIESLAAFFRYSISRTGANVRLREELNNVENYMRIQRYRFNNRFSMCIEFEEEDEKVLDCMVPKLILQPVVENAIYHGLGDRQSGGIVTITVMEAEKELILQVSDNGAGMSLEKLKLLNDRIHNCGANMEDGRSADQRNTGIALPNIHRRIQLLYGKRYGVDVCSSLGQGTDVEIMVPAQYEENFGVIDEKNLGES